MLERKINSHTLRKAVFRLLFRVWLSHFALNLWLWQMVQNFFIEYLISPFVSFETTVNFTR